MSVAEFFDNEATFLVSVAAGRKHRLALTAEGEVYAWGYGDSGQLGAGTGVRSLALPLKVAALERRKRAVKQIACGAFHNAAVDEDGDLFTWGRNFEGQCCHKTSSTLGVQLTPKYVKLPLRARVLKVACGMDFTVCIAQARGKGGAEEEQDEGELLSISIFCKGMRSVSVTLNMHPLNSLSLNLSFPVSSIFPTGGALYSWGGGLAGQLGIGTTAKFRCSPQPVKVAESESFIDIACGWAHSLALTSKGKLWTWGLNNFGQLGTGDTKTR